MTDKAEKWNRIYGNATFPAAPAWLLQQHAELLPSSGLALDIACGTGANSLFLARRGLTVSSWDISAVAIERLNAAASAEQLPVEPAVRDIQPDDFPVARFNLVINFHYLDRGIIPAMKASLAPAGILVFQTFVADKVANVGPANPAFLMNPGEPESLMEGLEIMVAGSGRDIQDEQHPQAGRGWVIARAA